MKTARFLILLLISVLLMCAFAYAEPALPEKTDIPVLAFDLDESKGTVEAMNADPAHQTKCRGTLTVTVPDGYTGAYAADVKGGTYALDFVRGRGNSTWKQAKKPYKIKLDKGADLLGMGKGKHWVLMAEYYDPTLLRNVFTVRLARDLGMEFAPRMTSVHVVMNGRYLGVYSLSTPVRVAGNAVDIADLADKKATETANMITGGYLLGLDPPEDEEHTVVTARGVTLNIESPDEDGKVRTAYREYITGYLNGMEDALFGGDFTGADGESYTEYLDIDSAADYFLIQQVSMNSDGAAGGSNYLYKKRNGKLYFGPLWDFDYCPWGAKDSGYEGFLITTAWFERMLKDEAFLNKVAERWEKLKPLLEDAAADGGMIDSLAEGLRAAQAENYRVNPFVKLTPNPEAADLAAVMAGAPMYLTDETATFDGEIAAMKAWIGARTAWVDAHLNGLRTDGTGLPGVE